MALMLHLHRFAKSRSRVNLYGWVSKAVIAFDLASKDTLLAIGAGGEIGIHLASLGLSVQSVDIDTDRHPDIQDNVEDLVSIADNSVDAVFCLEVLEHVANPPAAAASLLRVLKPGGLIIASTPFLLGVHDAPHDYYRFTEYGLRHVFSRFEMLQLDARNGYLESVAVLLYRRFVIGTSLQRRRSLFLSPVLLLLGLILEGLGRLLPAADGTSGYFFILRKTVS